MPEPSTPAATKATAQSREPASDAPRFDPASEFEGYGVDYSLGPAVSRAAAVATYERRPDDPVYRPLNVYSLDPASLKREGATAVLQVPYEPLEPGPKGAIFEVVDEAGLPVALDDPKLLIGRGLDPSPSNYQFHQQMVYAVCSSVYAAFRSALGRRLAWAFDDKDTNGVTRLKLRPHVSEEGANAAYHRSAGEIRFGYFPAPPGLPKGRSIPGAPVFTCLSHDIIAHELSHALIDGMRSHFLVPTGSDVLGFHEGFADTVAILQHFSYRALVESELRSSENNLVKAPLLLGIAQAFGLSRGMPRVLRSATENVAVYSTSMEAHEMGSVLTGAIFDAYRVIYQRKTERYVRLATNGTGVLLPGALSGELLCVLAAQASKLASQFLSICVRALDYCPPVDMTLGEYLRAIITADRDLVPDDPWAYREALIDAFAARGIYPDNVTHLSEDALVWRPLPAELPSVERLSFGQLRFAGDPATPASPDELKKQACALAQVVTRIENLKLFGLTAPWNPKLGGDRVGLPCVQSIRTARRVGPDGQIVFDLIAEVTQTRFVRDRISKAECEFTGGSTVILGPEGHFRYVVMKSILNSKRLEKQLEYQRKTAFWQRQNGLLVSLSNPLELVHERSRRNGDNIA